MPQQRDAVREREKNRSEWMNEYTSLEVWFDGEREKSTKYQNFYSTNFNIMCEMNI